MKHNSARGANTMVKTIDSRWRKIPWKGLLPRRDIIQWLNESIAIGGSRKSAFRFLTQTISNWIGMENSGIFKSMKRQWNISIT
jgi:hypothetical protein